MPTTTNDIVEQYVNHGYSPDEAMEIANSYIVHEAWNYYEDRAEGYLQYAQQRAEIEKNDERDAIIDDILNINNLIEDRENAMADGDSSRKFNVGCDFRGIMYIQEYEDDTIFIPKSDYCFIRCIEKIIKKSISKKGLSPYGDTLQKLRSHVSTCIDNDKMPDIIKVDYERDVKNIKKIKKKFTTTDKSKQHKNGYKILLLNVDDYEYHAILIKSNKVNGKIYEYVKSKLTWVRNLELDDDQIKLQLPKYKEPKRYVISYDIETSSLISLKKIKKENGEDDTIELRNQIPEGLSYNLLDLNEKKVIKKGNKIGSEKDNNCYDEFINELVEICKEYELTELLIYAHNGGCFDNIYIKGLKSLKILEQIKKGRIKKLKVEHIESGFIFVFLDTYSFFQGSLEDSCKYFDIKDNKQKFDIVNKDHNFFINNKEWIAYMDKDVEVLSKIILKYEDYIRVNFGESITTSVCGIASITWNIICNRTYGMNKIFRSKDPTTTKFIMDSRYGGRILHYRKLFNKIEDKSEGLICLDGNSLFPSAMFIGEYPVGKYGVIDKNVTINSFINNYLKKYLCIVEVTLDAGNARYPLLPYRTDKGCIIYPNGTFSGIYNSVDLLECLNDGYKIISFKRGIYWPNKKRIYADVIKNLYDTRNILKSKKNPMEYLYKIILNSSYGYTSLCVTDGTVFSDKLKPKIKGRITKTVQLTNGQYEHTYKLKRPLVRKPVHLASFILGYARKIMNNFIRNVGPENIWYSDTDSLYVKLECIDKIKLVDGLCGVKNDYGKDRYITNAIFLDLKRNFLEFNKPDDKGSIYKAKFNGINFKNKDCLKNWDDDNDNMKTTKKLYEWFHKNNNKVVDLDIIQERWRRNNENVVINSEEMKFQVNPNVRNNWDGDVSYPIKLDNGKVVHYENNVEYTYLGKVTEFPDVENYAYDINNYGLHSSMPLTCDELVKDITIEHITKKKKDVVAGDCFTSFIRCKNTKKIYKRVKDKIYEYSDNKMKNEIEDDELEYDELIAIPPNSVFPKLKKDELKSIMNSIYAVLYKEENSKKIEKLKTGKKH